MCSVCSVVGGWVGSARVGGWVVCGVYVRYNYSLYFNYVMLCLKSNILRAQNQLHRK